LAKKPGIKPFQSLSNDVCKLRLLFVTPLCSFTGAAPAQRALFGSRATTQPKANKQNQTPIKHMKKLLALALSLFAATSIMAAEYPDISIDDLKKAIADGKVAVIDVNGSSSYASGRVPGAIDFASEKDALASKLPADKSTLVVAYCGGPSCSAYKAGAKKAEELGYTNIKHLSAGISGWKKAGEKLEK
jgi:rhodanese-related sulfurtransferase